MISEKIFQKRKEDIMWVLDNARYLTEDLKKWNEHEWARMLEHFAKLHNAILYLDPEE